MLQLVPAVAPSDDKPKRGRKRIDDPQDKRGCSVSVSLTPDEYADINKRAHACGLKASAYFRRCAEQVAEHGFIETVTK